MNASWHLLILFYFLFFCSTYHNSKIVCYITESVHNVNLATQGVKVPTDMMKLMGFSLKVLVCKSVLMRIKELSYTAEA